jgi:hypothetical protein
MATEDKSILSSISPQDQEGTDRPQNNQAEDTIKHLMGRGYTITEEYSNAGQLSKVSGQLPPKKHSGTGCSCSLFHLYWLQWGARTASP